MASYSDAPVGSGAHRIVPKKLERIKATLDDESRALFENDLATTPSGDGPLILARLERALVDTPELIPSLSAVQNWMQKARAGG